MIKKAVISNYAWLEKSSISDVELFLLKKRLTVIPKKTGYSDDPIEPIKMFKEDGNRLGIPRHYWRAHFGSQGADEMVDVSDGQALRDCTPITLRPEDQVGDVHSFVTQLKENPWGGGIFEAYTGYGKSVSSLEIGRRLGGNIFMLVHTDPLMEQWQENVRKWFPEWKIGIVQGDTLEYRGKDFVIGMVQSMMRDPGKYPMEFYRYFRTFMCDEVHRFGALRFGCVAPMFTARYTIGLSGTVRRKDDCEPVFEWVIGPKLITASEENRINPIIYVRETGFRGIRTAQFNTDQMQKPTLLNLLASSKNRNELIAQDIIKSLKAGRNPLVMSERIDMLENVAQYVYALGQRELGKTVSNGMYIGGKDRSEQIRASKAEVVYATTQLAQEGIDIPRLDTLFLTTPISDPEQAIGRVCRRVAGKKTAMVVDYVDSDLPVLYGIFISRVKLYKRLGWQIIGMKTAVG